MAKSISKHDEELLRVARKRFETLEAAESHIRVESLDDLRFVYNIDGGQWPAGIRAERDRDGRPCLTANKLRKFVSIVANQTVTSRPAIGVSPVDDVADPATAKVYESLIRMIEYNSNAQAIYQRALEHSVAMGFGYWRILTRWVDDQFEQEIYLEGVNNPFSVYLDPDLEFGFIRSAISKDEFELKYPGKDPKSFNGSTLGLSGTPGTEDRIYLSEHFWKEPFKETIAQIIGPMGETQVVCLTESVTPEFLVSQGAQVLRLREVHTHRVKWATLSGSDVFQETTWPGKEIPIIEICGDKQQIEDKWYKRSLIRDAKDPQRMYNFWLTTQTEAVALTPKAPFLVTPEEIRGHEGMWHTANVEARPYLLFNKSGQRVPTRERPPEVQQGAMAMMKIADQDIKDVVGIFEAGLGEVSNERSGRAIKLRQSRSDQGTAHFQETFRNALILTGKQFIELIPKIYDTERVVRIQGESGTANSIPINTTVMNPITNEPYILHDLSVGRYDVNASIRVFQTRREEATEMMIQALQYAPMVAPYILDLIFKYADWPGAEEIGLRLEQLLGSGAMGTPNGGPAGSPAPSKPSKPSAEKAA